LRLRPNGDAIKPERQPRLGRTATPFGHYYRTIDYQSHTKAKIRITPLSRHYVFVWIAVGAVSAEWPLREAAAMRHKGIKIREKETRRQCRFGKIKTEEKNKGKNFSAFRIKILTLWQ